MRRRKLLRVSLLTMEPKNTMARKKNTVTVQNSQKLPYIRAKHPDQQNFIDDLKNSDIHVCINNSLAGSGKTAIAIGIGLHGLLTGKYERIILSRPIIEAGKQLGFLPGSAFEKQEPYLQPFFDEIIRHTSKEDLAKFLENGENRFGKDEIIICPTNFMRGRTFNNSYMILDEAQSCTREELLLFTTRLGNNSKAVIIGDESQSDLFTNEYYFNKRKFDKKYEEEMAFSWFMDKIDGCEGVSITEFSSDCVVRNPVIGTILKYMKIEK